jgi:hypothetical protein
MVLKQDKKTIIVAGLASLAALPVVVWLLIMGVGGCGALLKCLCNGSF